MNEIALVSSQQRKNLIFGTYETNTAMIRYEAYIKTAVTNTGGKVRLTTGLIQPDALKKKVDWYAEGLSYRATLTDSRSSTLACAVEFHPFARSVPTRFEVGLDELVVEAYYKLRKHYALAQRQTALQY